MSESFYTKLLRNTQPDISANHPPTGMSLITPPMKRKVAIVGGGAWGSAIATLIAANCSALPDFHDEVIWCVGTFEPKLAETINTTKENPKYMPGVTIPDNVRAIGAPDRTISCDLLVFVIPHQFIKAAVQSNASMFSKKCVAISLVKGIDASGGKLSPISRIIRDELRSAGTALETDCAVLMGANIAKEVAQQQLAEATVGCNSPEVAETLQRLFDTPYFLVATSDDILTVEFCGAFKNIVACASGFAEGFGLGNNTKAAILRLGLIEMIRLCREFSEGKVEDKTFLESCGVADLVTTCSGGRNMRCCAQWAKGSGTIEEAETAMLNGQKLQGPGTAAELYEIFKEKRIEHKFPIMSGVHLMFIGKFPRTKESLTKMVLASSLIAKDR